MSEIIDQQPTPAEEPPLKRLWANLGSKNKDFTVPYDEFEKDMQDETNVRSLYANLPKFFDGFKVPYDEFTTDMGLKKKEASPASVPPAGTGSSVNKEFVNQPAPVDPAVAAPQLINDAGAIDTASAAPGIRLAPGDEYMAVNEPLPSGEQLRQQSQDAASAKMAALPGTSNPDVREVVDKNAVGEMPPAMDYGTERVVIPREHDAQVPANTVTDAKTGLRYFDRPLSRNVDGKEQTVYEGAKALVKNSVIGSLQGVVDGVSAFANSTSGMPYDDTGDAVSKNLEGSKAKVSDLVSRQPFSLKHPETWAYTSAEYAPMVIAQVAQTLAGAAEVKIGSFLAKLIGGAATVAFDAPFFAGAANDADKAGLTGKDRARYIVLQGSLVLAGFKTGSKVMGELGTKLAMRLAPDAARKAIALDATASLAALEAKLGRTATKAETQAALTNSLQKVIPGILNPAKQAFQQAPVFAGAEAIKIGVNQVAAPLMGGKADDITPMQGLQQIAKAGEGGAVVGTITGGAETVLSGMPNIKSAEQKAYEARRVVPADMVAVSVEQSTKQLRGRTVLWRDERGYSRLGEIQAVTSDGPERAFILRDADGKLTRHLQGEVFEDAVRDDEPGNAPAAAQNPQPIRPAPQPLPVELPGGSADLPAPNNGTMQPEYQITLGELVPDNKPVRLLFGGEPVTAIRNQEGDILMQHADGQVSAFSKGEQFNKPADSFNLKANAFGPAPIEPINITPPAAPAPVDPAAVELYRAKKGDMFTLGSGEFANSHPIEDLMRKDGKITTVMVMGAKGPRFVTDSTPEGKLAIADLNAREGKPIPEAPAAAEPAAAEPAAKVAEPKTPAQPLTDAQKEIATALVYGATEGNTLNPKTLDDIDQLSRDVRAGKVPEGELIKRLSGAPSDIIIKARKALADGTLADLLDHALEVKMNEAPVATRTVEKINSEQEQAQAEVDNLEKEMAHPDFASKVVEKRDPLGLTAPTKNRVPLSFDALAKKRAYFKEQIANGKARVAELAKEAKEAKTTKKAAPTASKTKPAPIAAAPIEPLSIAKPAEAAPAPEKVQPTPAPVAAKPEPAKVEPAKAEPAKVDTTREAPAHTIDFKTLTRGTSSQQQGFEAKITDASGEYAGFAAGIIHADGTMQIDNSLIQELYKGKGYGLALYEGLIKEAGKRGLTFVSDNMVSEDAAKVYDKLAAKGYKVERNPTAENKIIDGKKFVVTNSGPAFTVTDGTAKQSFEAKSEPAKATAAVDLSDEITAAQDAAAEHNDLGSTQRGSLDGINKRKEVQQLAEAAGLSYSLSADNKVTLTDPSAKAAEPAKAAAGANTDKPAEPATKPVFARRRPTAADGEFVLAKPDGSKPTGKGDRFRVDEKTGRMTRQQPDGSWAFVPRSEDAFVQQQGQKYGFHADTPVKGEAKKTYLTPYEIETSVKQQFLNKLKAVKEALTGRGDKNPTATITKAVADGLRPVVEQAIKDNKLDVTVEDIVTSEGGYTYRDDATGEDFSETNPNITLVLSGNPEHIHDLMKALNQGADQRSGNSMAPVTEGTAVSPEAGVHSTLVIDLPKGMSSEAVKDMMDKIYLLKDKDGKVVLTGFTRIGDRILIGSHFFSGKDFTESLREVNSKVVAIFGDNSITKFKIQPYEVLSYDRPEDPTASAAEGNQEQVAGADSISGAVNTGNDSKRDATLETSSPLAAGFGRYYDSVLEGLNPSKPAGVESSEPANADAPAPVAEVPKSVEQELADIKAYKKTQKKEVVQLVKDLYKAMGKGSGLTGSVGGILSVESSRILIEIGKRAVRLGAGYSREVALYMRKATGLTKQQISDGQLKRLAILALKEEGEYKVRAKTEPAAEPAAEPATAPKPTPITAVDPDNTKTRGSIETLRKRGFSEALLERMKISGADQYTPTTMKELAATVDEIVKREGIDSAYQTTVKDGNGELPAVVMTALRLNVMGHYEAVVSRLDSTPTGQFDNQAEYDEALDRSTKVAEVYDVTGTEEAKSMNARRILTEHSPAVAVATIKREIGDVHAKEVKKLEPKAKAKTKDIVKSKKGALGRTLADPAIAAALDNLTNDPLSANSTTLPPASVKPAPVATADPVGYGSRNKIFTKTSLAEAKAALRAKGIILSAPAAEIVHFIGYHMEANARSFKAMSEKMVRDFGEKVRPFLREGYEIAKRELIAKGDSGQGFDGPDAVQAALDEELGAALADRVVGLAKPKVPGGPVDPVREMLDTLTKMVRETMEKAGDSTPKPMRDVIAAAVNNREQYHDVLEASKQIVIDKIDALKVSQSTKDAMHDKLDDYHQLIIGRPYADRQFARAMDDAMNISKDNYAGKTRGEQLNNQALAEDKLVERDRKAVMAHVSEGINDPALKAIVAKEAGDEFDARIEDRRRDLRIRGNVGNANEPTPIPTRVRPRTLPEQVRDLLGTRATDERVADKVAPNAVREGLKDMGKRLGQIARDHLSDPTETSNTLADEFVKRAGLTGKQARTFADAFNKEFAKQIAADKEKAINDAYNRAIRTGQTKTPQDVTDRINHLYNLAPTNPGRVLGLVAAQANLPVLSPADNATLVKLARAISNAKGDNAKAIAVNNFHIAVKNMRGITMWNKVKTVMYSGMLSGATTQIKNVATTGTNLGLDLFYATGWAAFKGIQHSIRARDFNALSLIYVPIKGVFNMQGIDYGWQMMRTGVRPPGFEGKNDESSDLEALAAREATTLKQKAARLYFRAQLYGGRGLNTNDLVWQGGGENMWAYNIAMNESIEEGRKQPSSQIWMNINEKLYNTSTRMADAYQQAEDELTAEIGPKPGFGLKRIDYNVRVRIRVRELMTESRSAQIKTESRIMAAESAFNGPMKGLVGDIMARMGHLTEAEIGLGIQPGKIVMPFTRIVANVTNAVLNYGPMGAWRAVEGKIGFNNNKYQHIYSPMERAIVGAKAVSMMALMAYVYNLNKDRVDGWLTGAGPSDPDKNREWQLRGNRPYTIDGWNYKDSMLYYGFAGVAALREAEQFEGADFEKDTFWMDRGTRMIAAAMKGGINTASVTGIQDYLNAMNDPSKGKDPSARFGRYVQRQAGTTATNLLIPNASLMRGISRTIQSYVGSNKMEANTAISMIQQELPGLRDDLPHTFDNLGNFVPVTSNIPFVTPEKIDDPDTNKINAFMSKNGQWIPTLHRFDSDMHILTLRNGQLGAADRIAMTTMTDPQRRAFLLKRLGGEEPMPEKQWDEFYPKRGKLLKQYLISYMPMLEKYAEISPRMLDKELKSIFKMATSQAQQGIDFASPVDPSVNSSSDEAPQ